MSFHSAKKFIDEVRDNNSFRKSLYMHDDADSLTAYLNTQGFAFTYPEFEEAYRASLVKCQEEEDAVILSEILIMYRMLIGISPSAPI